MITNGKKILVIKHGALGDIIQCEGALRDIREGHPGAHITILTEPAYARIMKLCPWVDDVVTDPRVSRWRVDKLLGIGRVLRDLAPDGVYDLQNSSRTSLYFRLFLKSTPWSGTVSGCSHPRLPRPITPAGSLIRLRDQLDDAGIATRHCLSPNVAWMASDVSGILEEAKVSPGYIVLIPGSSAAHPQKRWPYYAELSLRLIAAGYQTVTVPGPDELDLCADLPGTMLTGGSFLNWFDLAGVIRNAAFVVGNDTGPTHIAAHMDQQGIALFGSHTSAEKTNILRPNFEAIEVPVLNDLNVDTVLKKVMDRLNGHSNSV